jgi:glutamate racemase
VTTTIGIFDSGVGGLTVARALRERAPAVPIRYVADTAWFPYGDRPPEQVAGRALAIAARLVDDGCDLLIVGCNTASSAALEELRAALEVPVVGMEPPLKPAVERSERRRVAVLATPATARGERLARLSRDHGADARVTVLPMPGLAGLVERGEIDSDRVRELLREALAPEVDAGADAVALGCTHYGFLLPLLRELLPDGVAVLDAAEPVARRATSLFDAAHSGGPLAEVLCYATGDADEFERTLERLRRAGAALPPITVREYAHGETLPTQERSA